jgi:hypothetical protein
MLESFRRNEIHIDLRHIDLRHAAFFRYSLFIIFLTIVLGGKYRDKNTNYRSRRGITYITSSRDRSTEDLCANSVAISVNIIRYFIECG